MVPLVTFSLYENKEIASLALGTLDHIIESDEYDSEVKQVGIEKKNIVEKNKEVDRAVKTSEKQVLKKLYKV